MCRGIPKCTHITLILKQVFVKAGIVATKYIFKTCFDKIFFNEK